MATKKKAILKHVDEDLLGEDLLGEETEDLLGEDTATVVLRKEGDILEFIHAGGKVKGTIIKLNTDGTIRARQKIKNTGRSFYYNVKPEDIITNGETAIEHIGKREKSMQNFAAAQLSNNSSVKKKSTTAAKVKTGGKTNYEIISELAAKGLNKDQIQEATGLARKTITDNLWRYNKSIQTKK